jgi:NAD(P)-dependent dehydrogenase (short-subunit alcohol dehydrogenase family)
MQEFAGATVLITGAASGIGAATAALVAQRGAARLILMDCNAQRLSTFAATLACETSLLVGDVADPSLWARADLSGLTHALANAGVGAAKAIVDSTLEDWRHVMSVNLDGVFLTLKAAMTAMSRLRAGKGGAIVITASVAGIKPELGIAAYGSSKAAVIQLARIAAKEGVAQGVRVNSIAPGGVETPIWAKLPTFVEIAKKQGEQAAFDAFGAAATPLGRFAKAEEIAEQIAFLLSDRCAFVTGSCFVSDGGYTL